MLKEGKDEFASILKHGRRYAAKPWVIGPFDDRFVCCCVMDGVRHWSMAAFLRQVGKQQEEQSHVDAKSLVGGGQKAVAAEQNRRETRHDTKVACAHRQRQQQTFRLVVITNQKRRDKQPREENSPMCTNNNNNDDDDFKFRIHKCTGPRELQNSHCAHQQHQRIFDRHECAARERDDNDGYDDDDDDRTFAAATEGTTTTTEREA